MVPGWWYPAAHRVVARIRKQCIRVSVGGAPPMRLPGGRGSGQAKFLGIRGRGDPIRPRYPLWDQPSGFVPRPPRRRRRRRRRPGVAPVAACAPGVSERRCEPLGDGRARLSAMAFADRRFPVASPSFPIPFPAPVSRLSLLAPWPPARPDAGLDARPSPSPASRSSAFRARISAIRSAMRDLESLVRRVAVVEVRERDARRAPADRPLDRAEVPLLLRRHR